MLTAAIRVLARTAAIQLEEVAAAHAVHRSIKGKEREAQVTPNLSRPPSDRTAAAYGNPVESSSIPLVKVEESSPEVKEVEEKIQRLLRRVQRNSPTSIDQNQAASSSSATSASQSLQDRAESFAPEVVTETHSAESSKLPLSSRLPKTIQPSTPRSLPTSSFISSDVNLPPQAGPSKSALPQEVVAQDSPERLSIPSVDPVDPVSNPSTFPPLNGGPTALGDASAITEEDAPVMLRASKVPSSRIGRLFHYGSLAASLSIGAASETIRRSTGGGGQGSVFMSDANVRRLVATLGRMRGAALKLGQFMSIQDNHMLPPEIENVLQQVQAHANYMPDWQMEKVMSDELGSDWQTLFSSFDRVPIASASIGQVHKAILAGSDTPVAVKIQFPGIAGSINSDLANLSILIRSSALLPKGLYLQNTIAVMRRELEDECDYIREAASGRRFYEHLKDDDFFVVPKVIDQATTGKVLTTEWMSGKPLSRMKGMSQEVRDKIGTNILRLCLQELFQFRFMQTDPNWANFLYDAPNDKLQLIDFGASREYTKEFMDGWYRLLKAALEGDREIMRIESLNLGYLTGEENDEMLQAHLDSMALVASPFAHRGRYPFAEQTITDSVRALIPIMLRHRLTPPPPETYSLNRKLSGAFLMCARLGAHVDCQRLWAENVSGYKEG